MLLKKNEIGEEKNNLVQKEMREKEGGGVIREPKEEDVRKKWKNFKKESLKIQRIYVIKKEGRKGVAGALEGY